MVVATTPTFICRIPQSSEIDLTQAEHICFTLSQGSAVVDKYETDLTIEAKSITATLTQAESLRFQPDLDAEIQFNWTYLDGSRGATKPKKIKVEKNLHMAVIS